jgi:hypothetical protein
LKLPKNARFSYFNKYSRSLILKQEKLADIILLYDTTILII